MRDITIELSQVRGKGQDPIPNRFATFQSNCLTFSVSGASQLKIDFSYSLAMGLEG